MLRSVLVALALSRAAALALSREGLGGGEADALLSSRHSFLAHGLKNSQRPRMLVMLGCSGSSILMDMARGMLEAHRVSWNTPGGGKSGELVKHAGNPFFTKEGGMGVALTKANEYAKSKHATLVFKEQGAQSKEFRDAAPALLSMGTYVVHAYRKNVLDRMVCQIKDCFLTPHYGVPVGPDGSTWRLCFERRVNETEATGYTAKLNTKTLKHNLKEFLGKPFAEWSRIKDAGFEGFPTLAAEDLLDFEHDASALPRALIAWDKFMAAWGVRPTTATIKKYLTEYVGKYAAEPQSKTIYNFDRVEQVCRVDEDLRRLIRM